MSNRWNPEPIVKAFAKAALDPGAWVDALDLIAKSTGSAGAILLPKYNRLPGVPFSEGIAEASEAYFREGWAQRDPRDIGLRKLVRQGVGNDFTSLSPERISKDPYYQEFLSRFGLQWYGCIGFEVGDDYWFLSIQRTAEQQPFSERELHQLWSLRPALSSAGTVARALSFAYSKGLVEGLDVVNQPAFVVGPDSRILDYNTAASNILSPSLRIKDGQLVTPSADANSQIAKLVNAVVALDHQPASIALRMPGAATMAVHAISLPRADRLLFGSAAAMILLTPLQNSTSPPEGLLTVMFGLTPAEAKITALLAEGVELVTVAHRRGIALDTARNHLKAILRKTGCSRQIDLARLLEKLSMFKQDRLGQHPTI